MHVILVTAVRNVLAKLKQNVSNICALAVNRCICSRECFCHIDIGVCEGQKIGQMIYKIHQTPSHHPQYRYLLWPCSVPWRSRHGILSLLIPNWQPTEYKTKMNTYIYIYIEQARPRLAGQTVPCPMIRAFHITQYRVKLCMCACRQDWPINAHRPSPIPPFSFNCRKFKLTFLYQHRRFNCNFYIAIETQCLMPFAEKTTQMGFARGASTDEVTGSLQRCHRRWMAASMRLVFARLFVARRKGMRYVCGQRSGHEPSKYLWMEYANCHSYGQNVYGMRRGMWWWEK